MFTSLKGRSVIVTGASKGIGRGIALPVRRGRLQVLVVSRNRSEAQRGGRPRFRAKAAWRTPLRRT